MTDYNLIGQPDKQRMAKFVAETLAEEPDLEKAYEVLLDRFYTDAEFSASLIRSGMVIEWTILGLIHWYIDGLGKALSAADEGEAR